MNKLFFAFAVIIAIVNGQERYPAGLNPALCPGYPHCDNALLALYSNLPHLQTYAAPANPADPSLRYPAGVPAAACPNYPFCSTGGAEPLPGFTQRLYPADVPAAACPNYPNCY